MPLRHTEHKKGMQMAVSPDDVYLVILNNQLAKGRTLDEVIQNLSHELNQGPDEIKNMLSKQMFVIESGVSQKKAKETQTRIINAGVGCQVKKIPRTDTVDVSTLARNTQIICAKCGKQQAVSSNCPSCGIAFSKFSPDPVGVHSKTQQKPTNRHFRANKNTYKKPSSTSNSARNAFIGIFVMIAMVFAVAALNKNGQSSKKAIISDSGETLYAIETHSISNIDHYEDLIVPGYITIIDFSADWCPVCKKLDKFENRLVDEREDVIVRKLDVSKADDFRLALKKYDLNFRGVPHSIIFGKNGDFIASDSNNQQEGRRYIHSLIQ